MVEIWSLGNPKDLAGIGEARRPRLVRVRRSESTGCTDGNSRESFRVEVEKAMGELASTAESVEKELVCSEAPNLSGLVNHGEQDEVEADVFVQDVLVVVNVVWIYDARWEEGAEDSAVVLFTELFEFVQITACLTPSTVYDDKQGQFWAFVE